MPRVAPAFRKRVLRVLGISLTLDLLSFTFILPIFPKLLEFYRNQEAPAQSLAGAAPSLLSRIFDYLNAYKAAFARPIDSRYDIVLLGGALGSFFSLLQALVAPVIGRFSDRYGRRPALLASMAGNILSVLLWFLASNFQTFMLSRIVGGLTEGNVQLANAMASDVSDEDDRGSAMMVIGICFSVAFTFGPALGAMLSSFVMSTTNPFSTAALASLGLILFETFYLYRSLPETLTTANDTKKKVATRTNSPVLLNIIQGAFTLFFSGMEFSLTFMTYELFDYTSKQNGSLLGFVGVTAAVLQGAVLRKLPELQCVKIGVGACVIAFVILGRTTTQLSLYVAGAFLGATSGSVVTNLNALSSLEAEDDDRGGKLGVARTFNQLGRALGPVLFTSVYWWAGREVAYKMGTAGALGVFILVLFGLSQPPGSKRVAAKP